ncbi:zinc-ribbon domain-containing protein [Candidatus Bathyarchaeota archaeon]|nr:zinc-ribbon domain-containing protein [Candidatus Bathyarchaeota archaeon]
MYCPKCGAENEDEAAFCSKCGAPLDGSTESRENYYERRATSALSGTSSSAIPGLVIGAIVIFIGITLSLGRDIGQIIGSWGSSFGEFMGGWGSDFGEFMGNWGEGVGRFFAAWIPSVGVSFGAMIAIIIGLAIIASTLSAQNRR